MLKNINSNTKLFLSYTIPSMIGMLLVGSYSIIDTIFIGQSSGEIGLASVAITWPLVMLFAAVGDMLGTGAAVLISQFRGAKKLDKARIIFGNMLIYQIIFSIIMICLMLFYLKELLLLFGAKQELLSNAISYAKILIYGSPATMFMIATTTVIRNDGHPVLSMWLTVIGLLLNIVLDYIFIFPLKGGIIGAAYATVVAETLIALISLIYFATPYTDLRYKKNIFTLEKKTLKQICISGIPSFGNQIAIIAMLFFHNYQSIKYGNINGLAAYTFIGAIESLGSLLLTGLSLGIQPLIAYLYGAKETKQQHIIAKKGYYTAFIMGIILMLISFIGHNIFPKWFNLSGNAAHLASQGLIISSTAFILLGIIRVAGYYYQAINQIIISSLLIYGDAFFALPLCLFTLPLWLGLNGVWLAMPCSRVILFIFVLYLWFRKK